MVAPASEHRRPIRAWRAAPDATPTPLPHPALAAALLFAGGGRAEAAERLGRALRAERRLARQSDRRYDFGRHLALVAACAALVHGGGTAKPARGRGPARAQRLPAAAAQAG
jgi:hypothetical protein